VGAELLVPTLLVLGVFALVFAVVRWIITSERKGARAQQQIEDLSKISTREQNAQDKLTARKATLARLLDRFQRLAGMSDPAGDGGKAKPRSRSKRKGRG